MCRTVHSENHTLKLSLKVCSWLFRALYSIFAVISLPPPLPQLLAAARSWLSYHSFNADTFPCGPFFVHQSEMLLFLFQNRNRSQWHPEGGVWLWWAEVLSLLQTLRARVPLAPGNLDPLQIMSVQVYEVNGDDLGLHKSVSFGKVYCNMHRISSTGFCEAWQKSNLSFAFGELALQFSLPEAMLNSLKVQSTVEQSMKNFSHACLLGKWVSLNLLAWWNNPLAPD